jgi:hypothetical protein
MITNELKTVLKKSGLPTRFAANNYGGSYQNFYKMLAKPTAIPREKTLQQLCTFFNITPSELITIGSKQP